MAAMHFYFPILVILILGHATANGQNQPRRYQPSRPTVSPYLDLIRRDARPATNYHTLVRPQFRQQAINQQQQVVNLQQQSLVQQNRAAIQQAQQALLEARRSAAIPTGVGGGFMEYSHFYNFTRPQFPRR
jgi:hypothetical protein